MTKIDKEKLNTLQYNSLISAIPREWKIILRNLDGNIVVKEQDIGLEPMVYIRNDLKKLNNIATKDNYTALVYKKVQSPMSIETWCHFSLL